MSDYGRTRVDDYAVSTARKIGRFFLWLFAIIGFASTAFWLIVAFAFHAAIH